MTPNFIGKMSLVAPAAFAWLCIARPVFAHDSGLSTATVRLQRDRLEAVLVFSLRDAALLADLDKDRDGQVSSSELVDGGPALREIAAQALEVNVDDQPVMASSSRCHFDQNGNVSLHL